VHALYVPRNLFVGGAEVLVRALPNWKPLTGASKQCAKKLVCLRRRLYVMVEVRRLLRCLSATPEGVLNLAKEAFATRRQLEPR